MQELVSVIIPAYNSGRTIVEAIESVRSQTYSRTEIIVVDDGSTDDTQVILASMNDVRFFRQENAGPSAARIRALQEAQGDFVAYLDTDDWWEPSFLSSCVEGLNSTKAGFAFTNWRYVSGNGEVLTHDVFASRPYMAPALSNDGSTRSHVSHDTILDLWLRHSVATPSGIVIRRRFALLGWDVKARVGEDRLYMLDAIVSHDLSAVCCSEIHWNYRVHENNAYVNNPDHIRIEKGEIYFKEEIRRKYASLMNETQTRSINSSLAKSYCDLGYHLMNEGQTEAANHALKSACLAHAGIGVRWRHFRLRLRAMLKNVATRRGK